MFYVRTQTQKLHLFYILFVIRPPPESDPSRIIILICFLLLSFLPASHNNWKSQLLCQNSQENTLIFSKQSVPFPQDNNIHTLVLTVPHRTSNTSQIIMNNPEASNDNAGAVSLIEQVRAATQSNPSLARELSTFLLDTAPDSQPVTKEQHPVFFDATKNPGKLFVLIPNKTWCSERSRANV